MIRYISIIQRISRLLLGQFLCKINQTNRPLACTTLTEVATLPEAWANNLEEVCRLEGAHLQQGGEVYLAREITRKLEHRISRYVPSLFLAVYCNPIISNGKPSKGHYFSPTC
jgi:hypothetical protein